MVAAGELLLGPARETAWRYVLPGVGARDGDPRRRATAARPACCGAVLLAAQESRRGGDGGRERSPR